MKSKIHFLKTKKNEPLDSIAQRLGGLFAAGGFSGLIQKKDYVAIKMHFGEKGNKNQINPLFVKAVADQCHTGLPFVTDTNTLYVSSRGNAVAHLRTAEEHGYTLSKIGVPVIIADGLISKNYLKVPINQKHFQTVNIASDIVHADVLIGLAHITGHIGIGYGGTLKNLGMGCSSRSGKQQQHANARPKVTAEKCTACGRCIKFCPEDAIQVVDKIAVIDEKKCSGCGECTVTCRFSAIAISWGETTIPLQEKITEYAYGALQGKKNKCGFMNFIIGVTKNCDCMGKAEPNSADDLGVMASLDPVALDKATIDTINQHHGKDIFKELYPTLDYTHQLHYATKIGLGNLDYEIEEI